MTPTVKASPEEVADQVKGKDVRMKFRSSVNRNPRINRDLSKCGSAGDDVPRRRIGGFGGGGGFGLPHF